MLTTAVQGDERQQERNTREMKMIYKQKEEKKTHSRNTFLRDFSGNRRISHI